MSDKRFPTITTPAERSGDVTIKLEAEGAQTKVHATWKDGTAVQEGASELSAKVSTADLQSFLHQALQGAPNPGSELSAKHVRIAAGAGQRSHAATVAVTTSPDKVQQLEVKFYSRASPPADTPTSQTDIPSVEFSKANYLYGLEYMEEWRATWQRAIALAWSDPVDEPGRTCLKSQLLANPFHFFKTYCNYALPPTVDLLVVDAATLPDAQGFVPGTFSPDNPDDPGGANAPNWRWVLPRSVLIMFLPPPPADDKIKAVALAAYEAVGKSYPFTMTS